MKKIFLFLFVVVPMLFAYPLSADAMKMSKPIELGRTAISEAGGFHVEGAVKNTGKVVYTDVILGKRYTTYDKGYAVFGKGDLAIYAHYGNGKFLIGGKSIANTLNTNLCGHDITAIKTDAGIVFYYVVDSYYDGGGFVILGKLPDGRFVQYANVFELEKLYHWTYEAEMIDYGRARVENNVIIIPYSGWQEKTDSIVEGEIRFTWDEKAQWFGAEKR